MTRVAKAAALAVALAATPLAAAAQRGLPAWTRGATCYEVFVRSFADSDGDGVGDLRGLVSRLDYINDGNPRTRRDLGARCIWLMPVAESPSYHGYDVADYYRVDREYGTNDDFKRLVREAHRRGIRVLVDLVLNHASSEHPHFQAALRDTASPYRAWFRWSDSLPNQKNPWGGVNWHRSPVRNEYFYGLFWSGMPDLNYTHPPVREEARKVARFWLEEMGVDGFRLDAIAFLVEENGKVHHAPGTHAFLREFASYVRSVKPDAFTVGEVWDSTSAMLPYYPDQLDAHFAFEIADSIVHAVRRGSATGLLSPVLRLQRQVPGHRWSPFLRNHDQPRTRTELGGDVRRARLASFILLTMPGVPFVYYGEEIGMTGTKPDERIRTPMQWTAVRGAGFTSGKPWQQLQEDSLRTTVATQERDPRSILALHRRMIHLRALDSALATGELVPLTTSHEAVAAYARRQGDRVVLVVANLGDAERRGVALSAAPGTLPPGRWAATSLLGGRQGAPLTVRADGSVQRYLPLPTLAPLEGYLFELSSDRSRR